MPGEDNAALVAKFLDELWNKRNVDIIDQLTVKDYIVHIPQGDLGREALKEVAKEYFERFSLIHLSIVDQTSQDSQVVTRIQWDTALELRDQSHDQEIERKIPARGDSIDRIDNGQIAESWNMLDTLYWLFNIQELSREPAFVQILPAVTPCNPNARQPCLPPFVCMQGHCVFR
jgi:predicted SnoaL-like aldol condensation-catalyzing enzyme